MDNYYVYEWIRLDTNEPFYVGKGHSDRWCKLTRGNNKHFNNIVKSKNCAVVILEDDLTEQEAFEYEIYYIDYYFSLGFNLVNLDQGGKGSNNWLYMDEESAKLRKKRMSNALKGRVMSESQKAIIQEAMNRPEVKAKLGSGFRGKHLSEEHRRKVSENNARAFLGKHHTEEAKEKNRLAHLGKPGLAGKSNPRSRKVICLNTLKVFDTLKEASAFYSLSAPNHIGDCCMKKCKQYGEYEGEKLVWRYFEDYCEMTPSSIAEAIKEGQLSKIVKVNSKKLYINDILFESRSMASMWLVDNGFSTNKESARNAIGRYLDKASYYKGLKFRSLENTEVSE